MQWFENLQIRVKLLSGFFLVAVIAALIGVVGYFEIHEIGHADTTLYEKGAIPLKEIGELSEGFQRMRVDTIFLVLAKTEQDNKKYDKQVNELRTKMDEHTKRLEKALPDETARKHFATFTESLKSYTPHLEKIIALANANKDDEAMAYIHGPADKAEQTLINDIDKLMEYLDKNADRINEENKTVADRDGRIMIGLALLGLVLAVGLGLLISGMITAPVAQLAKDAAMVANGDLTVQVSSSNRDEVGRLADSFRTMTENLRSAIRQVSDTSNNVSTAASQLQVTAEQIATGAEEVVAQAQTVATAGEEMAATANDIAGSCQSAAAGAMDASSSASDGSVVVNKTVQAMEQIARRVQQTASTVSSLGERSDQIGAIVGTIEDIADQTNLLALNAAIEAARAGEMGRGFAVVADEVRALAERTTKATKEISEMIRTIQGETRTAVIAMEEGVREVQQGTSEASKSGQALQNIMEQVNMVSMQVSQVATAAEEQTATTGEISNNMQQITEVIQQTARGAHESANAASQLSRTASDLQSLVRKFRI